MSNNIQATVSGAFPTIWFASDWTGQHGQFRVVLMNTSDASYQRLGIALDRSGTGKPWIRGINWYSWDIEYRPFDSNSSTGYGPWVKRGRISRTREKYALAMIFRWLGNPSKADALSSWVDTEFIPRRRSFFF